MYRFFINRPIVAIGRRDPPGVWRPGVHAHAAHFLQFPNIVPPEIRIQTTFVGGDAQTLAESVATPIEEQMSGVDNMNYMYAPSRREQRRQVRMGVNFDVKTDPRISTRCLRSRLVGTQAEPQLPRRTCEITASLFSNRPTTPA